MEVSSLKNFKRTGYCAEFNISDEGKKITIAGWVQKRRILGGLIFIDLRDRSGILQLTFDEAVDKELFEKAYTLRSEDVITAVGTVRSRGQAAINKKISTGEIEVLIQELKILSRAETPPFEIIEKSNVNEELRLKYRYLDLRRPDVQSGLIMRHKLTRVTREYFDKNNFLEIETPNLIKSTPRGSEGLSGPEPHTQGKVFCLAAISSAL